MLRHFLTFICISLIHNIFHEIVLHRSLICLFVCVVSRGFGSFHSGLFFQRYLYSTQPCNVKIVAPSGAESRFGTMYYNKDNVFLCSKDWAGF